MMLSKRGDPEEWLVDVGVHGLGAFFGRPVSWQAMSLNFVWPIHSGSQNEARKLHVEH